MQRIKVKASTNYEVVIAKDLLKKAGVVDAGGKGLLVVFTGMYKATKSEQLTNFAIALQKYSGSGGLSVQKNWILAFYELTKYLESLPDGKKVIFIDELPWMDTAKSGFIAAL